MFQCNVIIFICLMSFLINGCAVTKPGVAGRDEPVKERPVASPVKPVPGPETQAGPAVSARPPIVSKKIEIKQKKTETQPAIAESKRPAEKAKASKTFPGLKKEDDHVTLDFKDEKFCNVLKVFSYITGKNVIAPDKLSDKEISIYLKDVSPKSAIHAICEKYNLWYEENEDYIRLRDLGRYGRIVMSEGKIKELRFEGQDLDDALCVISNVTGRNVTCNENIAKKKVTLHLENIPVKVAIEVICKKYNLWYRDNGDYIRIMSAEDYGKDTTVDYKVKTRVFNLKYASAPQVADTIGCVMGERVDYNLPTNLESYINITFPDINKEHIAPSQAEETTEVAKEVKIPDYEKELTSQKLQDLMRKKLKLSLTSEDIQWIDKKLGFAIISIFMRNNSILACSPDNRILDEIQKLIEKLDTPTPQVLIECKILSVNLTNDFTSFFKIMNVNYRAQGKYIGEEKKNPFSDIKSQLLRIPFFGVGGAQALYNFVDDRWKLDAELKLLEDNGVINEVATPMIVAAQNTEAKIKSAMVKYPFFKEMEVVPPVVPEQGGNIVPGYAIPKYERTDVGMTLKITPQINEDKSVTLRIYIDKSDVARGVAEIKYPLFSQDGAVTALETARIDVKSTESANTIIDVPENNTLILGGFVTEKDLVTESKVPFFGDIPFIGFFFKDHNTKKQRTETVFLLTPHVMMAPEKTGEVSEKALEGMQHPIIKEGEKRLLEFDEEKKKLRRMH